MIADFAKIPGVAHVTRARLPWTLVAASLLLFALLVYVLFASYLPAKQRIAGLESELKEVYAREAALQNRLAIQDARPGRDQVSGLRAERDALARRIQELERELTAARNRTR
jgi:type II secretory pathway component PulM